MRSKTDSLAGVLAAVTSDYVVIATGKQIDCAFVYGSVARTQEHALSDVDLMVVGSIGLAELSRPLRKIEQPLGR